MLSGAVITWSKMSNIVWYTYSNAVTEVEYKSDIKIIKHTLYLMGNLRSVYCNDFEKNCVGVESHCGLYIPNNFHPLSIISDKEKHLIGQRQRRGFQIVGVLFQLGEAN